MINYEFAYAVCIDDISTIENYEKAVNDNSQTWVCHHKKGVDISRDELIILGLYYHQPASDLIFLTKSEHNKTHKKVLFGGKKTKSESAKKMWEKRKEEGWCFSEEALQKMSDSKKGKDPWNKGKKGAQHHSEETKKRISEKMKGGNSTSWKKGQTAWNKGMPGHTKGKKRYTNGKVRIYAFECPEGFWEGWK